MHRDLAVAFLGFGVTKPNPVLHIHLNSTGPTARLTARRYRARLLDRILLVLGSGKLEIQKRSEVPFADLTTRKPYSV